MCGSQSATGGLMLQCRKPVLDETSCHDVYQPLVPRLQWYSRSTCYQMLTVIISLNCIIPRDFQVRTLASSCRSPLRR